MNNLFPFSVLNSPAHTTFTPAVQDEAIPHSKVYPQIAVCEVFGGILYYTPVVQRAHFKKNS